MLIPVVFNYEMRYLQSEGLQSATVRDKVLLDVSVLDDTVELAVQPVFPDSGGVGRAIYFRAGDKTFWGSSTKYRQSILAPEDIIFTNAKREGVASRDAVLDPDAQFQNFAWTSAFPSDEVDPLLVAGRKPLDNKRNRTLGKLYKGAAEIGFFKGHLFHQVDEPRLLLSHPNKKSGAANLFFYARSFDDPDLDTSLGPVELFPFYAFDEAIDFAREKAWQLDMPAWEIKSYLPEAATISRELHNKVRKGELPC